METRVPILKEAVCISYIATILEKGMNPTVYMDLCLSKGKKLYLCKFCTLPTIFIKCLVITCNGTHDSDRIVTGNGACKLNSNSR